VDWLLVDYWPWWLSACGFATITVGMWLIERRLLGVSGVYTEALRHKSAEEKKLEAADPNAIEDALLRATLEEFGPEALEAFEEAMADDAPAADAGPRSASIPRSAYLLFLVMLAAGGAIGGLLRGGWHPHFDLGTLHSALTGGGAMTITALLFGGFLVGFGTRMAGGCTSGHGLSGCSRLQPGSLAATASFFGTAVAVSFLLEALR